jgi:hypothetical protein
LKLLIIRKQHTNKHANKTENNKFLKGNREIGTLFIADGSVKCYSCYGNLHCMYYS